MKNLMVISTILFLFFTIGCTHYYYGPNTSNAVLLRAKEAKLNLGLAAADEFNAFEFQGAVALAPNVALMVNGIAGGGDADDAENENLNSGNARFGEAGLGYFTPLNEANYIFETYAGYGLGGITNNYDFSERSVVNYNRIFVQPGFGFRDDHIEWGISSRFSFVKHSVELSTLTDNNASDLEDILYISQNPNSIIWEPGLMFRVGGPKIKGQIQYTYSLNLTNSGLQQEKGLIQLGINIPIQFN